MVIIIVCDVLYLGFANLGMEIVRSKTVLKTGPFVVSILTMSIYDGSWAAFKTGTP